MIPRNEVETISVCFNDVNLQSMVGGNLTVVTHWFEVIDFRCSEKLSERFESFSQVLTEGASKY